jgi:predicted PurR-regulated permease PerM
MPCSDGVPGLRILVPLATVVLLVATLRYARDVLVPLFLAILLTFVLSPLASRLEKAGLRRAFSVVIVSVLFIVVAVGLAVVVGHQVVNVASEIPLYRDNIDRKLDSIRSVGNGKLKGLADSIDELEQRISSTTLTVAEETKGDGTKQSGASPSKSRSRPIIVQTPSNSSPVVARILRPAIGPIGKGFIVLVLLVFMLVNRESLRNRIFLLSGRGHLTTTTKALQEAGERVTRYLVFQSMVNATFGLVIGTGLYFIGIPNPILWGVLSGLLRYLPYIGPIIATSLPTVLSLAVFTGWHNALYVLCLYVVAEATTAYFIEPLIYGTKTGITALSILVAAIFWGVIWGPIGLLLSTPLTVCLVAFGRHIPQLEFLTVLLGDEMELSPEVQVYQRLLADDPEEARSIAKTYLEANSVAELYDYLFIPVLVLAEQDFHREALDDERRMLVFDNLKELIEDLSTEPDRNAREMQTGSEPEAISVGSEPGTRILAVPACDESDEIASIMLGHLLNGAHYRIDAIVCRPLNEMLREISDRAPQIVCISAVPPSGIRPARTIYRNLKRLIPNAKVVLGLWKLGESTIQVRDRIGLSEPDKIVSTLAEAAHNIHILCYRCR